MTGDVEQLGERIAEQAAHLDAATHRLLTDLREFDERGGWRAQGTASCAHWLAWRVGWDLVTARDHVRVARKLAGAPLVDDALRRGEVSYSKVRAVLRVATPENESLLLEYARLMTASQLEKLCRKYALVQRHGQDPSSVGDEPRRYVRRRDTEDGMVKIEAVLHPEEAEMVWAMLDHAAVQLSRQPASYTDGNSAESVPPEARHFQAVAIPADPVAAAARGTGSEGETDASAESAFDDAVAAAARDTGSEGETDASAESAFDDAVAAAARDMRSEGEPGASAEALFEASRLPEARSSRSAAVPTDAVAAAARGMGSEGETGVSTEASVEAGRPPEARSSQSIAAPGDVVAATARDMESEIGESAELAVGSSGPSEVPYPRMVAAPAEAMVAGGSRDSEAKIGDSAEPARLPTRLAVTVPPWFGKCASSRPVETLPRHDSAESRRGPSLLDQLLDEADALRGSETAARASGAMQCEAASPRGASAPTAHHVDRTGGQRDVSVAAASWRHPASFHRADALVALAQGYLRGDRPERSPVEVTLTIPLASLHDDAPDTVEVAEMGASFLSTETARRLSCDAGVVEITEDDHGAPLSVGRKRRTIAGALKRALRNRDRACTFPGCTNHLFLEGHHIKHWANGGETSLRNAILLCSLHHRYVHEYGYTIELGADQRPRFRDPRGRVVDAVPARLATTDLGWPWIRKANEALAIDAATIAGPWDGTPVDYGTIAAYLAAADGLS